MNDKLYIHEFVDIIGHNRAKYMYHMTANFSPMAQEDRDQLCYGVWGILGTTRGWPEVLNLWEEQGFDGMASSFRHEAGHASLQDPKLAKWWAAAEGLRRHGDDRLLAPAPWTRTSEELCRDGVGGEVYAHEQVKVTPGRSSEYLEIVRQEAVEVHEAFGWELAGAWETAMVNDDECFLLWAIPTWEQWAAFEQASRSHPPARAWRRRNHELASFFHRFLLVDAPLSPFRTKRQPRRSDRTEPWDE